MPALPLTFHSAADARLTSWRENVGEPVALDLAPKPPATSGDDGTARSLVVLSWNVWIGRGDLVGLISRLRSGAYERLGAPAGAPFVVLVQEAYRADGSIPAICSAATARDFSRRHGHEQEIAAVAHELGLDLCYAPSMRNRDHRSDRGNAILSSLPLEEARAVELPFSFQRRVAVGATVAVGGRRIRLTSAHLDPRGATALDIIGIAGRARQARDLVETMAAHAPLPLILGADLNLARGRREPAFRQLADAGFVTGVAAAPPAWSHTYHRLPRMSLDYLLFHAREEAIARAEVHRLDEHPRDQGPYVFGSDHHPLLARVDLA
jgi:endonuclease/exonuclease/phosphatase family metal-dependent hydrolase